MLKIYDLKERKEYIEEVARLLKKEWCEGATCEADLKLKILQEVEKIKLRLDNKYYCTLILLEEEELIGFISIFEYDLDERKDLSPWYATMYVKEEYRKKGYSRILNDAILKEAKRRGFEKLYLKTELKNYYEKFGAKFIEKINQDEQLLFFDLK